MPRVTFNRLSKKKSNVRRRRTSTLAAAKYKPRTARANRSLIKGNALAIRAVRRLMPPPVYTDYQYSFPQAPFIGSAPEDFFTLQTSELMNPTLWTAVLRRDQNAVDSSQTLLKRLQGNLRYSLQEANWCQITTFVVSIRKDAADRIIDSTGLTVEQDYIYSSTQSFNPRLNPAVFKVHYVRNVSLMSNAWLTNAATAGASSFAGNPNTTYSKGQVNMKLDFRIRQPAGTSWKIMDQNQFSPNQRLYLLSFFKGNTTQPDDNPPRVDADFLYTCYNSG